MTILRGFAVWLLEISCQALGTALWIAFISRIQFGPDTAHDFYGYVATLFGMSFVVLIEFALTGYIFTTLLSALFLPRGRWFFYPSASFGLYLVHSSIFFVAAGNRLLEKTILPIQIGGACIAFAVTLIGDRLRHLHTMPVRVRQ